MAGVEVRAVARNIRMSSQKVRRVLDTVRGKPVGDALAILRFLPHKATEPVAKLIQSASANAENNFSLSADELTVISAVAEEGPTLKRGRPRAQGRYFGILKRTSHITVAVADQEEA